MILEAPEEWDRRKERRVKLRREAIKVKLGSSMKTIMVGAELIGTEVTKMTELLK